MFIDRARLVVRGGDGGGGVISFRREAHVPRGGPDGGDGGKGGDVILRVDAQLGTLTDFRFTKQIDADAGRPGSGRNSSGRSGADRILSVPPGTLVIDRATKETVADLTAPGEELVVARGGSGGKGNARFATSTRRAPRIAEDGGKGEQREIDLELKLLADVGLAGLPNAGKSTLLAALTSARPKIADYPFTTLVPNLGVARLDDREPRDIGRGASGHRRPPSADLRSVPAAGSGERRGSARAPHRLRRRRSRLAGQTRRRGLPHRGRSHGAPCLGHRLGITRCGRLLPAPADPDGDRTRAPRARGQGGRHRADRRARDGVERRGAGGVSSVGVFGGTF